MHLSYLLTSFILAGQALAGLWCLTDKDAAQIGDDFALLISAYNATFANSILASDFTDQSDSVITLIDSGTTAPIPVSNVCHDCYNTVALSCTGIEQCRIRTPLLPLVLLLISLL